MAQTGQGLVVFGGDGYPPAGRHTYLDDLWLLRSHSLSWRKAKLGGAAGAVPSARRAHSTVLYRVRSDRVPCLCGPGFLGLPRRRTVGAGW